MHITADPALLSDTLRYRLQARRTLQQDEVRISVNVKVLIQTRDNDQATLDRRIHDALGAFMSTRWLLSRIERGGDAAGYERVQLVAITRVKATENYNLAERARLASHEGLSLENPRVDYGLSIDEVDRLVTEMRYDIIRQVNEQIAGFNRETGREWRLGDIEFGIEQLADRARRTGKGAYRDTDDLLGRLDPEYDEGSLSGSERITLTAAVTLRATPPSAAEHPYTLRAPEVVTG